MEKIEPEYPKEMSREELLAEIPLQIIRNRIAIAHADSVLRDNEIRMQQLRAEKRESDVTYGEAVAVLQRAGLLH